MTRAVVSGQHISYGIEAINDNLTTFVMPDLLTHKSTAGSIRAENIIQSHLTDSMNEIFMGGTAARSAYARNYFLKALIFELGTARLSPYDAWVDPAFAAEVIENGLEEYYEKMNA